MSLDLPIAVVQHGPLRSLLAQDRVENSVYTGPNRLGFWIGLNRSWARAAQRSAATPGSSTSYRRQPPRRSRRRRPCPSRSCLRRWSSGGRCGSPLPTHAAPPTAASPPLSFCSRRPAQEDPDPVNSTFPVEDLVTAALRLEDLGRRRYAALLDVHASVVSLRTDPRGAPSSLCPGLAAKDPPRR